MNLGLLIPVLAAALVGFLTGLLAFRVKSRWCPTCGRTTDAEIPAAAPPHPRPRNAGPR